MVAATALLLASLGASLQAAVVKPRVAVVFEERVQGVFGLSGSWVDSGRAEEALLTALRENGYSIVDPQAVRANLLRDQAVQVLAGDEKAAIAAGSRLQAPYVIVGKGFAKSAGAVIGSSMKSMQAQVQLNLPRRPERCRGGVVVRIRPPSRTLMRPPAAPKPWRLQEPMRRPSWCSCLIPRWKRPRWTVP